MEKIKEIIVKDYCTADEVINIVEESLFRKEKINLIAGVKSSSVSVIAAEQLVKARYATIENIQTLTEIKNNRRFVKLIITLKRESNFKQIYEEDTIELIYKPKIGEKISVSDGDGEYYEYGLHLFNSNFVSRNKNKCKIIYKNKLYKFTNLFDDIDKNYEYNDLITIKLKGINNIKDYCAMFYECVSLILVPDISKLDISNVKSLSLMFSKCESLISLPDISNWDTSNIESMSWMFSYCKSLISLPDISKWDTSNVEYIFKMFSGCSSLISLPDISKWNTSKVKAMECFLSGCKSLISLPDISKWDTSKSDNFCGMFSRCKSLISLPDISKWDISKSKSICDMFSECSSLISLPDISNWDTFNADICDVFFGCESLISLPDILKWNTTRNYVIGSEGMFNKCLNCLNITSSLANKFKNK